MLLTIAERTDSYAQFLTVLVIFVVVLGLTAVTTKWIAGYQKQQNFCGNIEMLETQRITSNKYIQIVRVGQKYLVIAVCKDTVTMITEIPREELVFREDSESGHLNFKELLDKAKQINSGKKQEAKEK